MTQVRVLFERSLSSAVVVSSAIGSSSVCVVDQSTKKSRTNSFVPGVTL
jgi:hypothetical protein